MMDKILVSYTTFGFPVAWLYDGRSNHVIGYVGFIKKILFMSLIRWQLQLVFILVLPKIIWTWNETSFKCKKLCIFWVNVWYYRMFSKIFPIINRYCTGNGYTLEMVMENAFVYLSHGATLYYNKFDYRDKKVLITMIHTYVTMSIVYFKYGNYLNRIWPLCVFIFVLKSKYKEHY